MVQIITGLDWGEKTQKREMEEGKLKTLIERTSENEVIGEIKAYTTRKGEGGFPTEEKNEIGEVIQQLGEEIDPITEESLRCGWLDLVMLKQRIKEYGITAIGITKLDVIGKVGHISEIKACKSYRHLRRHTIGKREIPEDLEYCKPMYESFIGGWDIEGCKTWDSVSGRAKRYVEHIEKYLGVPVRYVKIGSRILYVAR